MKTHLIYLEDPYQKTMDATVLDVIAEADGVWRVILDRTVFYPLGGGQPTDQGWFIFPDGTKAEVNQVRLNEGEIHHYIKAKEAPQKGQSLSGEINWQRRYQNMKVHSAGHIIDFAVHLLGYSPSPLHPLKGDHGKKPFILYAGVVGKNIQDDVQRKTDELIAQNLTFSWSFQPLEIIEKEAIYLQPGLPQNKPLRMLKLEGVGAVADGGTIVSHTGEVGRIQICSIEQMGNETCLRYQVAP